ncbi:Uncharacterised protein [Yersinia pekkanenii]|uniref:Uncharacterized protein n=1 Tax=Yersinia pekkanenii TaxID=1288385 RepID=A0A0T9NVQ9_9GAMM|nr:Uncharacterised protein [Yersinia pekkanenii]CRY63020.1 Uncharacterised protein [Yersinia pekkanenii]
MCSIITFCFMVDFNTTALHSTTRLLLNHDITYEKINYWLICW